MILRPNCTPPTFSTQWGLHEHLRCKLDLFHIPNHGQELGRITGRKCSTSKVTNSVISLTTHPLWTSYFSTAKPIFFPLHLILVPQSLPARQCLMPLPAPSSSRACTALTLTSIAGPPVPLLLPFSSCRRQLSQQCLLHHVPGIMLIREADLRTPACYWSTMYKILNDLFVCAEPGILNRAALTSKSKTEHMTADTAWIYDDDTDATKTLFWVHNEN